MNKETLNLKGLTVRQIKEIHKRNTYTVWIQKILIDRFKKKLQEEGITNSSAITQFMKWYIGEEKTEGDIT